MKKYLKYWPFAAIVVALIVIVCLVYANYSGGFGVISEKTAIQRGVDYINKTILNGQNPVVLKSESKIDGIYKMIVTWQGKDIESYVTLDGKLLIPGTGYNLAVPSSSPAPQVSINDQNVLLKYDSKGEIPLLILGCKYYRVGSGEAAGQAAETKNLTALFCSLTGSKPDSVCAPLKDLIAQMQKPSPSPAVLGEFTATADQLCSESGKPIIYFFGSEACPHCQWEKPIFEGVVNQFKDLVSFHENISKSD